VRDHDEQDGGRVRDVLTLHREQAVKRLEFVAKKTVPVNAQYEYTTESDGWLQSSRQLSCEE
jgi:ABC-type taurine transport system substrate-binding protein